ncbi:Hypothetical predicted protein [Olea europaea subsp. europaea]|uniref:Inhibitor I9 domain-containing protein n=1 Tax=Olea europaea subsp. europaea TaxID=158383 RepID=A0A8S0TFZ1_OLEEU|nr:Hypothetical predicted protein [Olea europaea subsp. europaea]
MQKIHFFLFTIFFLFLTSRTATAADSSLSEAKVYIVYTEKPEGQEPEAYAIKTLSSVLGSEDAAKEALIYIYKYAANGFSAKLTPDQASQLSKMPGVLQVDPSRTLQLDPGPPGNMLV